MDQIKLKHNLTTILETDEELYKQEKKCKNYSMIEKISRFFLKYFCCQNNEEVALNVYFDKKNIKSADYASHYKNDATIWLGY